MTELESNRILQRGFFFGLISALLVFLPAFLVLWKTGRQHRPFSGLDTPERWVEFKKVISESRNRYLDIPAEILNHLKESGVIIENAGNPTSADPFDNLLMTPDKSLRWRLKPNLEIIGYQIRSNSPLMDLEPPVAHVPYPNPLNNVTVDFLENRKLSKFVYRTDEHGLRRTLSPTVGPFSKRGVLVFGGSMAFGAGVSDSGTFASHLQRHLGKNRSVYNAGVKNFNYQQAADYVRECRKRLDFSILIFLPTHSYFMNGDDWTISWGECKKRLREILAEGEERLIVVNHTYLQANAADILGVFGWQRNLLEKTKELADQMKEDCLENGWGYLDWTEAADSYAKDAGTRLAVMGLYFDHSNLSREGYRVLAQEAYDEFPYLSDP